MCVRQNGRRTFFPFARRRHKREDDKLACMDKIEKGGGRVYEWRSDLHGFTQDCVVALFYLFVGVFSAHGKCGNRRKEGCIGCVRDGRQLLRH